MSGSIDVAPVAPAATAGADTTGTDTTTAATVATISPAPAPATMSDATGSALAISEQTAQWVIKAFALTICLIMVAITAVLCYRVYVDGNQPLTTAITQQLSSLFPWLAFSLVTVTVGKPTAQALLAKFLP